MAREGFVVYHDLLNWLEPYADDERGRLLPAMLAYSLTGEAPGLTGNERFLWPAIKVKIDKDKDAYERKCRQLTANGSKRRQNLPKAAGSAQTETEAKTETGTGTKKNSPAGSAAHARGCFGWVKLTDAQYERLKADLGEAELERCIRYVDESAQKTGNKNRWKDWNLVIRACHRDGWGLQAERRGSCGSGRLSGEPAKPEQDWNIIYD